MISADQIKKAIGAHGTWKAKLQQAIETGKSPDKVDDVRSDNHCEFGKWLYSLQSPISESPYYKKVKDLHAQFHIHAGRIIDLALTGKKAEALKLISIGSNYDRTSVKLTQAMLEWAEKN